MKKNLLTLAGAAALALGLGACAYDPYYSGLSGTAVNVGYGYGHGYGGSSFSTSYFWGTGNSAWGYDPYVRCYYNYGRRAYYDPYLCGYYPVGFRPRPLVGVPHPHGYRHGWCPPPSRVSNVTVVNYRDRQSAYRNMNHSWARQVQYDTRTQRVPAPPTRERGEIIRSGGSNPFFGGLFNQGGGTRPDLRTSRGSTFQPRATTFPQPTREIRPERTRPTFGSMPDMGRPTPQIDRSRSRSDTMPRIERPSRQIEMPAPRVRESGGDRRESSRSDREERSKSR